MYLATYKPHIEARFNFIEILNELTLTFIVYCFLSFMLTQQAPLVSTEHQWIVGYAVIAVCIVDYVINLVIMAITML